MTTTPPNDLHAQIMNIPCPAGIEEMPAQRRLDYKAGHRDARHAAAELVSATPPNEASPAAAVPEGWKLVPTEPTEDMLIAGQEAWARTHANRPAIEDCEQAHVTYCAMLSSSPAAPAGEPQSQWISVKDRTPPAQEMVLVWVSACRYVEDEHGQQHAADCSSVDFGHWQALVAEHGEPYMDNYAGRIGEEQAVTHWMPLPPAPGAAAPSPQPEQSAAPRWKVGNEFAPFHPQASHVSPDYRDGWNACYRAATSAPAAPQVVQGEVEMPVIDLDEADAAFRALGRLEEADGSFSFARGAVWYRKKALAALSAANPEEPSNV